MFPETAEMNDAHATIATIYRLVHMLKVEYAGLVETAPSSPES